jgi:RecB family exonuclease
MHSQPGQPRRGGGRRVADEWAEPPQQAPVPDPRAEALRQHLETVRQRARGAASWLTTSSHYTRLLNRDGVVPVTARFTAEDLAFLATAREELLRFAELGLQLADLHQPLEAAAITSDPAGQFPRCRSCMWRWPCPTFRILDDVLAGGLRT